MDDKYRYLAKNIVLFFVSSFLPKTLSFFMIPLYTKCLSTADYGVADLLSNTVSLVMPLLTLQVQDAVLRFSLDKRYDKKSVFTTGIKISTIGGFLLISVCVLVSFFAHIRINNFYILFLIINYFSGALNNIAGYFCRGIDKISILTIGSVTCTIVSVICNLLFLLVFNWNLNGYLLANSIGAIIGFTIVFFGAGLIQYVDIFPIDRETEKEMILFSLPMIISALSWWMNNASDKYILTIFYGVSVAGIYAVAYKIPTILSVLGTVIAKAYSISAIKEFDSKDSDGFIGKTYSMISLGMTMCCAGLILCNMWLSRILFANDFYVAWRFVPPLLVSVLMQQLSLSCENIFIAINKTNIISNTALAGTSLNTILNFLLIPFLGAYGAAIATMVGFGATWLIRYIILKRYATIRNNELEEVLSYLFLLANVILAYFGLKFLLMQIILTLGIILIYIKDIQVILKRLLRI